MRPRPLVPSPAVASRGSGRPAPPSTAGTGFNRWLLHPAAKPVAFVLCLLPLLAYGWGAFSDALGANPAEALIRGMGDWTLRMLCLTLAITPLRRWTGWNALLRLRRMLGLYTFFYGVVHFLCFAWLDMGLDWSAIVRDVGKRPFILVGTAALLLMLPLAATSFDRAVRWLGGRRWRTLHRAVYAVAGLALLHFFWMRAGKQLFGEPTVYAVVIVALLGARLRPPRPG
jgi:sulfoxide reductase heme-binding subunit YedZ